MPSAAAAESECLTYYLGLPQPEYNIFGAETEVRKVEKLEDLNYDLPDKVPLFRKGGEFSCEEARRYRT